MTTAKQKSIRTKVSRKLKRRATPKRHMVRKSVRKTRIRKVTRVRKNPLVSKEQKFLIEAMQDNGVPMYYNLGSRGVSKPLQGLFTTNRSRGSRLNRYNAETVARAILPYLDKRLKWVKVVTQ